MLLLPRAGGVRRVGLGALSLPLLLFVHSSSWDSSPGPVLVYAEARATVLPDHLERSPVAIQQLIGPTDGEHVRFGMGLGTRRMLPATATGGSFGLVEHDLPARELGSPVHTHEREDEYSYVLRGRLTAKVGDDVIDAGPGELVVKPRGIPHAFWNTGNEPVRFLELISPGGFEEYFFELAAPFNARDEQAMGAVRDRYRLDIRPETIPELLERNGLQPPF